MLERRLFPALGRMALLADAPELVLVRVVLFVAVQARGRERIIFAVHVALVAKRLRVLAVEFISAVLRDAKVEDKGRRLPAVRHVAGLADLVLELPVVLVLVAVEAGLVLKRLVCPVGVAL